MSKTQTRKSLSISGELYQALKSYANQHESTQSNIAEAELRKFLGLPPRSMHPGTLTRIARTASQVALAKELSEIGLRPAESPGGALFDTEGRSGGSKPPEASRGQGNVTFF